MPGPNTIDVPATVATTPAAPAIDPKIPAAPEPAGDPSDIPTGAEGQPDGGEGAPEGGTGSDVADAIKSAAEKYEFIVDGKPITKELTKAQVKQLMQKGMGADTRFQQAAKLERMNQELIWLAKNAPEKLMQHQAIGVDPYDWAEKLIYDKLKLEQMDPKDRELMETQNKLKETEQKRQEYERHIQQEKIQRATQFEREKHSRDISGALQAEGMPVNNWAVRRVAHYMLQAMDTMGVQASAKDVMPLVLEDYKSEQQALFGSADADKLASILGEENLTKVRKHLLAQAKIKENPAGTRTRKDTSLRDVKPNKKPMTMSEFRDYNERQKRGEI